MVKFAIVVLTVLFASALHDAQGKPPGSCLYWQSRVDPSVRLPKGSIVPDISNERARLEAMECLLDLEGNTKRSTIVAATRPDTSQTFGAATVEVAALYYVSYLYYEKWGHAGAAFLRRKGDVTTDRESVAEAYKAYRKWFIKVKEIGLSRAREEQLDPFQNTDLSWY